VTRFDDVMQVLRMPDVYSSRAMFTMVMAGGNERCPIFLREVWRFFFGPDLSARA
jgi:hypothetical protein